MEERPLNFLEHIRDLVICVDLLIVRPGWEGKEGRE